MEFTISRPVKAILCTALSSLLFSTLGFAQAPENILATSEKFKPTVTFGDTYSEKILTIPGVKPDPATHEKVSAPQKIAAKVVGDITGFDFTEIGDDTTVSLTVGTFAFERTLVESLEAQRTGSFPTTGKKATFQLFGTFEKANGDTYEKLVGTVVYSWTAKALTVTLACSDIAAAGIDEITASDFYQLYVDESELGNKPTGTVKFADQSEEVTVGFGSAVGSRIAYGKGSSTSTYKKYGSDAAGTLEEFSLESVTVAGAADVTAPKVTATVPVKDTDDGYISFLISVTDTPVVNLDSEIPAPIVEINILGPNEGEEDTIAIEASELPEVSGAIKYQVEDLPLYEGTNTVTITTTDASGNFTVVKKTVTVTLPAVIE